MSEAAHQHTNNHHGSQKDLEAAMEENENGLRAFTFLGEYLQENNWHPQQLTDKYIYRSVFHGKNGMITCYAQVRVDAEQFLFYALSPVKVPQESLSNITEFITRANYGMYIGNFELDLHDGEVRYKSSVDFEDVELTADLIRNAIWPAVHMMDKYLPGMFKCIYGGVSATEAIAEIES